MLANKAADRGIGGRMKGISSIEKADHRVRVEDYRHSSRSPST